MSIPPYVPPLPDRVPRVTLILTDRLADPDKEQEASQTVHYEFTLVDADGRTISHPQSTGNALPHLIEADPALAQMAKTLIEAARALVEAAVIPQ